MAFEISGGRYVVVRGKIRSVVLPKHGFYLAERPDVEPALLAFRVGVEAGGEGATAGRHLAGEPADSFDRPFAEQVVSGAGMGERQQFEQLGIVVKHLLEVRHEPALVD